MVDKIDVCINVYGKPYQTLITIKSLLEHSGDLIDKIYFIEDPQQPETFNIDFIKSELDCGNMVFYKPKYHLHISAFSTDIERVKFDDDYRLSLRYQYGLENTDKKYLMIIHNDVLFTSDIVSDYIEMISDNAGIGQLGQCWNCPMNYEELCNGETCHSFNPSYKEVTNILSKYKESRTFKQCIDNIDPVRPMPLPECRLNEMHCMVNVEYYRKEVIPNGDIIPFGGYFKLDLADEWYRQMVLKGYKFKNVDPTKWCQHGYFNIDKSGGHQSLLNPKIYYRDELLAKKYYKERY